jgi:hypothetical protein
MENKPTKEISDELLKREGVSQIVVDPYEEVKIITGQNEKIVTGPAIIIINQD